MYNYELGDIDISYRSFYRLLHDAAEVLLLWTTI